tara:strand:- start:5869 stop:6957 length:1089 start_codon:yes stop_codon:yes gene_type:complete
MLNIFKNKTVLVTGHTGFKGSWLVAWLKFIGAQVVGVALPDSGNISHYEVANLGQGISDNRLDIRNFDELNKIFTQTKPDFVFHLAAQALVRRSYDSTIDTWSTNVIGTVNVLEALRQLTHECCAVIITSDKCYDNVEWLWGYREDDRLGGPDPYSASKGSAEIAIQSYMRSFFSRDNGIRIASARAGNVIGGGDWSEDRIIPDCIRAWSKSKKVTLRNPESTRPWQHVLEPLSGYLRLATGLYHDNTLSGESFNFGPDTNEDQSVLDVVSTMSQFWKDVQWDVQKQDKQPYESNLLKLNCDKARSLLNWHAVMGFEDTIQLTAEWYKNYYANSLDMFSVTKNQIITYVDKAKEIQLDWANG